MVAGSEALMDADPCSAKTPSLLISLDFQVPEIHAPGMKILITMAVAHSFSRWSFLLGSTGGMDPDSCTASAAGRVQTQGEEADPEKPGPAVLVFAFKDLERLEIELILVKRRM